MKKLLFLYDYFDPAFKAGGPIRSLVNLVHLLDDDAHIFILSSNCDHDCTVLNVKRNTWLKYGEHAKVQYLPRQARTYQNIKKLYNEIDPDTIYINGIYSIPFVVYPSLITKSCKIVIAPRGMLQREPLSIKPFKKRIYLFLLRRLLNLRSIVWHVTTEQEKSELLGLWPGSDVQSIGNVPSFKSKLEQTDRKLNKPIVFGTIALISPMKNIDLIFKALNSVKEEVIYRLYGPVKDTAYWKACQPLINELPGNVSFEYHGEINPGEIEQAIQQFDFYIQPSKSENFGHSIFEAFNQGIPVIISDQTPWRELKAKEAGWDVDLNENEALKSALEESVDLDDEAYNCLCRGSRKMASDYVKEHYLKNAYLNLFCDQ